MPAVLPLLPLTLSESLKIKDDKAGLVCGSGHEMITCKWVQALDVAHPLTPEHQKTLFKLCPYLRNSVDHPEHYVSLCFTWIELKHTIDRASFGVKTSYALKSVSTGQAVHGH